MSEHARLAKLNVSLAFTSHQSNILYRHQATLGMRYAF